MAEVAADCFADQFPDDPSTGFTIVLAGDVRSALSPIELGRLSTDPFANPWAYLGKPATVTATLDSNGNTDVNFVGTFAISNADFFCAGGPPCNGLPHFGLDSPEVDALQVINQYWAGEPFNQLPSLTVDGPQLTGPTPDWAVVFADVTSGGNTVGQWWEVPYTTDTGPLLRFLNNTAAGETLSNVGFLLSSTEIPLDALNFGTFPPPGQPGSRLLDLPGLDGLFLRSGGSISFTATPEPSALAMLGVSLWSLLRYARRRTVLRLFAEG